MTFLEILWNLEWQMHGNNHKCHFFSAWHFNDINNIINNNFNDITKTINDINDTDNIINVTNDTIK